MSKIKLIILVVFIVIICAFIIQNPNPVTVNFLWWEFHMSVFAIPVIITISAVSGYLLAALTRHKNRKKDK